MNGNNGLLPTLCQKVYIAITIAFLLRDVNGLPSGPPVTNYSGLCLDMKPSGHGGKPSDSPPPYTLYFNESEYSPGKHLQVTLETGQNGSGQTEHFKGFFILIDNLDETIVPHGTFGEVSEGTQVLNCSGKGQDAWGHTNSEPKTNVTALWLPPITWTGPLVARATVVYSFAVYWQNITSDIITFKNHSDNEIPVIDCPVVDAVNVTKGTSGSMVNFMVTAHDADDGEISPTCWIEDTLGTETLYPSYIFQVGDTIVTCNATDTSGNTATCSLTITVLDNEEPIMNCPPIYNDAVNVMKGVNGSTVNLIVTAHDVVDGQISPFCLTVDTLETVFQEYIFPVGETVVVCVATDRSNNTAWCFFYVYVLDNESPVINCPAVTAVNVSSETNGSTVNLNVTANDIVDGQINTTCWIDDTFGSQRVSPDFIFPVGETTVTCNAFDASGNTDTCSFDVTVLDHEIPVINCPVVDAVNVIIGTSGSTVNLMVTVFDVVDGQISPTCWALGEFGTDRVTPEYVFLVGDTIVQCNATDTSGNTATCSFIVNVSDNEIPVIDCPADDVVTINNGTNGSTVNIMVTATDVVDGQVKTTCWIEDDLGTKIYYPGYIFQVGDTIVTCNASDASGNTATCSFNVAVIDEENPFINCPLVDAVNVKNGTNGSTVNLMVTANDIVDGRINTTCWIDDTFGSWRVFPDYIFPVGETTVTCNASDASGNTDTCSFDVTVLDHEIPVINCPVVDDVNVKNGTNGSTVNLTVTAFDIVDGQISPTCWALGEFGTDRVTPEYVFLVGDTIVQCNATDTSGNTATCSFIVNVSDNEIPVIDCPADDVVTINNGTSGRTVNLMVTATDVVDGQVKTTCWIEDVLGTKRFYPGYIFQVGDTIVTCNASGASGNTATCSFNVAVIDDENPFINCPLVDAVSVMNGTNGSTVNLNVTANDIVDGRINTTCWVDDAFGIQRVSPDYIFPVGATTVTCNASDASGNTDTCSFDVTVLDHEIPVINCPVVDSVNVMNGTNGSTVNLMVTAFDIVDGQISPTCWALGEFGTDRVTPEYVFLVGDTRVQCNATDTSGNTTTCSFNVNVLDNEIPVIDCPADDVVTINNGTNGSTVNIMVTATDVVDGQVKTTCWIEDDLGTKIYYPGYIFQVGDTIVTCNASDASGNTATCSFNVAVLDDENPFINCPPVDAVNVKNGTKGSTVNLMVTAIDIVDGRINTTCWVDGAFGIQRVSPDYIFPVGETTVTCIASDASDNTDTCSFGVTVLDNAIPVLDCPSHIGEVTETNGAVVDVIVTAYDDVDGHVNSTCWIAENEVVPGYIFPVGDSMVTCSAMDAAGNTALCNILITVSDMAAPVIECPTHEAVDVTSGKNGSTINLMVTANDIVDGQVSVTCYIIDTFGTQTAASGYFFQVGDTTVSCNASDEAGNVASCTFDVTVSDNEIPVIDCPSGVNVATKTNGTTAELMVSAFDIVDGQVDTTCWIGEASVLTRTISPAYVFELGGTLVTCRASDTSGNTATCSFVVTITDENECLEAPCPGNVMCVNLLDGFTCLCSAGYIWNGTHCDDVDECINVQSPSCPVLSTCLNSIGSFQCLCQSGFTLTSQSETGLLVCLDIDECLDEGLVDCHSNAGCFNQPGGYTCLCLESQGYRGNGTFCAAYDLCESSPCLNQGICSSTLGTGVYNCSCTDEFTGTNCGLYVEPLGPPAVLKHPRPDVTVNQYEPVTLQCSFDNVQSFAWSRNDEIIPGSAGKTFLTIGGATLSDRGYYKCIGTGLQDVAIETNSSLLLIAGVSSFSTITRFPTLTFNERFSDKTSSEFQQASAQITTFLTEGLQSAVASPTVVVGALQSGSVIATSNILTLDQTMTSDLEKLNTILETLLVLAMDSNGFLDPSSISIQSTGSCVETTWSSIYGTITFPPRNLGSIADSEPDLLCPDYTLNAGMVIGTAVCVGDGFSVARWSPANQPELNCGRNLTTDEKLEILNQVVVTETNVMEVATQVVALTEDAASMTDNGVTSTADIMEKVASVDSVTSEVTVTIVDAVGNLIDVNDEALRQAEATTRSPSRVVKVLEKQLENVQVSMNSSFREVRPNIAVEVRRVTDSTLLSGLGFASAAASSEEGSFGNSSLVVMEGNEMSNQDEITAVLILPPEVNILARDDEDEGTRVSFTVFRKRNLFQSSRLTDFNQNENNFNRTINTRVMSATVGTQPIRNLNEPVKIILNRLDNGSFVNNTACVFWDFDNGVWSSEGCTLRENYGTDQQVVCQCDHLTNFAALMDIYPESSLTETQEFILKLLSLIGCGMSILGLSVTMVTYISHRKLREKSPNQILLNLCSSLLGLYITFVVATVLDSQQGVAEVDVLPCCILAGLLHYFTLTSLCWMGVEGFNMYLLFIRIVNVYIPKFMLKAALVAWGVPMLIVSITVGVTREDYVETDFCFLKTTPMIVSLLVPIGLIIVFNLFIFSMVVRKFIITTSENSALRTSERRLSKRKLHKQRLQNALTVMTLIGLTWSIGYLNLVQPISFPIQLIFCLLNTLQGYFIFMLYGVRQPEVRRHWKHCCALQPSNSWSGRTYSDPQSSSAKTQLRTPFDPKSVPQPTSQIYRRGFDN